MSPCKGKIITNEARMLTNSTFSTYSHTEFAYGIVYCQFTYVFVSIAQLKI